MCVCVHVRVGAAMRARVCGCVCVWVCSCLCSTAKREQWQRIESDVGRECYSLALSSNVQECMCVCVCVSACGRVVKCVCAGVLVCDCAFSLSLGSLEIAQSYFQIVFAITTKSICKYSLLT